MSSDDSKEDKYEKRRKQIVKLFGDFLKKMDPLEAALFVGLGYLGYEYIPDWPVPIPDLIKILWGPIGLKLATTPAEGAGGVTLGLLGVSFPVNSQIAGLSMLAALGFACLPWEGLNKKADENKKNTQSAIQRSQLAEQYYPLTKEELNELRRLRGDTIGALYTRDQQDIDAANLALTNYVDMLDAQYSEYLPSSE